MRRVAISLSALIVASFLNTASSAPGKIATGCFIGATYIQGLAADTCVTPDDWQRVMQSSVIGSHGLPLTLLVRRWQSSRTDMRVARRIRRCNEYFATHVGPPIDNAEQRVNGDTFRRACGTGQAIMDFGAGPGAFVESYLARDGSDLLNLEDVPAAVLELAWLNDLRPGGPTLAGALERGELKVTDARVGQLRVSWREYRFLLYATGRADVNGDGFEDLIVVIQSERDKGGDRGIRFAFLTRKAAKTAMAVVRLELKR